MTMHELSRTEARRIAVRAQLLDASRPTDVLDVVRHLSLLQHDQTNAVAPNAHLVLWTRLGTGYDRDELDELLRDASLVELRGLIRPGEDVALYRAEMAAWPDADAADWEHAQAEWVEANGPFRQDVLDRLEDEGPLVAREIPDSALIPWRSSGWNNNRNVSRMLELLERRGEVATAGHRGRDRRWNLANRVFPDDTAVPLVEAVHTRNIRRLKSLGIARAGAAETPVEPDHVGDVGEAAVIDGVAGHWRVDPDQLGRPFRGRAALLSPLDRLVFDRKRMAQLFEFDYQLEMYKPAAKRKWGYWAMPILYGDRLVGKLDATADRRAGVLSVDAIHRDVEWTKTMSAAVDREITDLARWLDLDLVLPRTAQATKCRATSGPSA